MQTEIITALISSLIGGLLVAVVNYLLTKNKTQAETAKLKAEAEKIKAEADKIRVEVAKLSNTVVQIRSANERIIYDGNEGISGYDVEVEGKYHFKDGAIVAETVEGFKLRLLKYICDGQEREFLAANNLHEGDRRIRVSCEAKVTGGYCNLTFALIGYPTGLAIGQWIRVAKNEWTAIELYFRYPFHRDCQLSMKANSDEKIATVFGDVQENPHQQNSLSYGTTSIQLRKLVMAERLNAG
jgi:hypothetical protein